MKVHLSPIFSTYQIYNKDSSKDSPIKINISSVKFQDDIPDIDSIAQETHFFRSRSSSSVDCIKQYSSFNIFQVIEKFVKDV